MRDISRTDDKKRLNYKNSTLRKGFHDNYINPAFINTIFARFGKGKLRTPIRIFSLHASDPSKILCIVVEIFPAKFLQQIIGFRQLF